MASLLTTVFLGPKTRRDKEMLHSNFCMNMNECEQYEGLGDEWDSSDTRDSTKKWIQILGTQQYPETGGQLGELHVYSRNRY